LGKKFKNEKKADTLFSLFTACLHDQNKSGFFGGPAFFQPIRAFRKFLKLL